MAVRPEEVSTAELLAPAGDFETALAAFEAGADAVYCGLADFSARAFAKNFSFEDLEHLLAYAWKNGKKVYVTFNTLLDEDQVDGAIETLARLEEIGPDGVIVQDLGVAKLIRDHFPELPLHASTQLVAHNLEGVLALRELGFTRVVLARELSVEEVASIAKRCGDIELEVFIHGALCYSLSGLCLFGAMEKGRSGNRGKCPYCCREGNREEGRGNREQGTGNREEGRGNREEGTGKREQGTGKREQGTGNREEGRGNRVYPFSMKDLRLGEDAKKLVNAGVASLKIEGRMKSPLYVASVTKYYRQILGNREQGTGKREQGTGNREQGTGNREQGTGNREEGRGNGERGIGNGGRVRSLVTVADLETVFSRRTTELYLNGKPSESVIDSESLGHLGAEIGTVKRVTKDREGRAWLRFHTCRGLEKHDGLQFEAMTDEGRHLGMGVVEMRQAISRRPVFEVNAGVDVEVLLPGGEAPAETRRRGEETGEPDLTTALKPGMKIYCSMSNAVKRMFPTPSFRPSDFAGQYGLDVELTIARDRVTATVDGIGGAPVVSATGMFEPAKNPEKTREAAEKAFSKLGGTGYALLVLSLHDPEKLFVPASVLNGLRRDLVVAMDEWRDKGLHAKIEAAKEEALVPTARPESAPYRRLKVRARQKVPAGEWDEVVVAINAETTVDQLSSLIPVPCSLQRLALPVYTAEPEFNRLRSAVKRFLRAGYGKWEASDLATLRMLKQLGVTDITADWTLYAFNARALAQISALGVKRFVASPENGRENLQYLAESGYDVEFLTQQSTPLFVSLTEPAARPDGLAVYRRDGLWVTTKPVPRTFEAPEGTSTRLDLSWDPE